MTLSLSVQTTPLLVGLGPEEAFRRIAEAGFTAVDLNINDFASCAYVGDPASGESIFDREDAEVLDFFAGIGEKLAAAGLRAGQCHAPFPNGRQEAGGALLTPHRLRLTRLSVAIAERIGCPCVVVHPGFRTVEDYDQDPAAQAQAREENDRLFLSLLPALEHTCVQVAVENMRGRIPGRPGHVAVPCSHAREMISWIDRWNERAGREAFCACLDTGHAVLTGDDPAGMARALGHRLRVLHLHDSAPGADRHSPPFDGTCPWDDLCAALGEIGYSGTLNFETGAFIGARPEGLRDAALAFLFATGQYLNGRITAPKEQI